MEENNNTTPEEYFESTNFDDSSESAIDDKATREASFFNGDLTDADVFLKIERFKLQKQNEDSERTLREKNAKLAYMDMQIKTAHQLKLHFCN